MEKNALLWYQIAGICFWSYLPCGLGSNYTYHTTISALSTSTCVSWNTNYCSVNINMHYCNTCTKISNFNADNELEPFVTGRILFPWTGVIRFSHGEPALPLAKNINNYITTTTITTITTTTTTTITTTYYYHYYYYYYSLFIYIQCSVCGSIRLLCLMLVSLCGHCHVK